MKNACLKAVQLCCCVIPINLICVACQTITPSMSVFSLSYFAQKRAESILKTKGQNMLRNFETSQSQSQCTDRKNVTDFLYLVLHLACKVTCYFWLFSSVLVSVLRTSINVLSKSKSKNYVTWIANLTKLFLSVYFNP